LEIFPEIYATLYPTFLNIHKKCNTCMIFLEIGERPTIFTYIQHSQPMHERAWDSDVPGSSIQLRT
jgi:hypothetical protein